MIDWETFDTFEDACEACEHELGCCQYYYTQFRCRVKRFKASDGTKLFFVQNIDKEACDDERYEIDLIIDFENILCFNCKDGRTRTADNAIKKMFKILKMWSESK